MKVIDLKATTNKVITSFIPAPNTDNYKLVFFVSTLVDNEIKDIGWGLSTTKTFLKSEYSDNFFSVILQSSDGTYALYINNYTNSTGIQG